MTASCPVHNKSKGGDALIEHRTHLFDCFLRKLGSITNCPNSIFWLREIFNCLLNGVVVLPAFRVIEVLVLKLLLCFQALGNCALQLFGSIPQFVQLGHSFLDLRRDNQYISRRFAVGLIAVFTSRDVTSATEQSEHFLCVRKNEQCETSRPEHFLASVRFPGACMKGNRNADCNAKGNNATHGLHPRSLRFRFQRAPANPFAIHVFPLCLWRQA